MLTATRADFIIGITFTTATIGNVNRKLTHLTYSLSLSQIFQQTKTNVNFVFGYFCAIYFSAVDFLLSVALTPCTTLPSITTFQIRLRRILGRLAIKSLIWVTFSIFITLFLSYAIYKCTSRAKAENIFDCRKPLKSLDL